MAKILKDADGTKLYPVCGFQRSQHKIYYWENKYYLLAHSDGATDEDYNNWLKWSDICQYTTCVYDGLIYMPYKYYNIVKEAIVSYDLCH